MVTLNVAQQTSDACNEGLFDAQADLEETRKRRGRGSFCSNNLNKATFMIHISDVL